ncbi:MAG: aspartyl/asparaginyl beta-hydroxylase domain-containing protein [Balneolaceae bacterium]|nr:aspartyl/asparaginyl beta-hydroxylase domain-containing protein [Balneolaceae bacterium]
MKSLRQTLKKRKKKLVKDLGGKFLWSLERMVEKYSKVPTTPLLDPYRFNWPALLEKNWHAIRWEMNHILEFRETLPNFQEISEDQQSISDDDNWKTYFLYGFGYKAAANCARCPQTTRLIEQIPGMKTAFFSILKPGKHIPEHRGVFKGILRYHLGLKVPEPREQCWFRIGDQMLHWEEGKSLLFDDTYPHEVKNDTGGTRVVLLIDVVRPLKFPANLINKTLIGLIKRSSYVQDARRNQQAWEKRFNTKVKKRKVRNKLLLL